MSRESSRWIKGKGDCANAVPLIVKSIIAAKKRKKDLFMYSLISAKSKQEACKLFPIFSTTNHTNHHERKKKTKNASTLFQNFHCSCAFVWLVVENSCLVTAIGGSPLSTEATDGLTVTPVTVGVGIDPPSQVVRKREKLRRKRRITEIDALLFNVFMWFAPCCL